ncbi:unnamed protein product, partial [Rotaria magnacalcarata]
MRQKGATSGITVAGRNGGDEELNKLKYSDRLFVHEKTNTLYVSDTLHNSILKFTNGSSDGIIVAGQQ